MGLACPLPGKSGRPSLNEEAHVDKGCAQEAEARTGAKTAKARGDACKRDGCDAGRSVCCCMRGVEAIGGGDGGPAGGCAAAGGVLSRGRLAASLIAAPVFSALRAAQQPRMCCLHHGQCPYGVLHPLSVCAARALKAFIVNQGCPP